MIKATLISLQTHLAYSATYLLL